MILTAPDWSGNWGNLDTLGNGADGGLVHYVYEVSEPDMNYYKPEILSALGTTEEFYLYALKNTYDGHINVPTMISVTKVWQNAAGETITVDDDVVVTIHLIRIDRDGKREVYPYNGRPSVELSNKAGWSWTFRNLPYKSDNEVLYTYSIEEDAIEGYEGSLYLVASDGSKTTVGETGVGDYGSNLQLVNAPEMPRMDVTVDKQWAMADGSTAWPAGKQVTVQLYRVVDGTPEAVDGAVTLNANQTTQTWSGLPKVLDGKDCTYYVQETVPTGFDAAYGEQESENAADAALADTGAITIKNTEKTTTLDVNKVWAPATVTTQPVSVQLYKAAASTAVDADGWTAVGSAVTLNAGNSWSHSYTKLPLYEMVNGTLTELTYKVDEVSVPEHFTKEVSHTGASWTVTNTYEVETTQLTVQKRWFPEGEVMRGNENPIEECQYEAEITLKQLDADGNETDYVHPDGNTQTITGNIDYTWTDLPKTSEDGQITFTYEVEEKPIEHWEADVGDVVFEGDHLTSKIKNSYVSDKKDLHL